MIWESGPWKDELLRAANRLSRVEKQRRLTQRALFVVEKEVALGCYSVRKLIEGFKLSDSTKGLTCRTRRFPNVKRVTSLNWHRLPDLYDMRQGRAGSIGMRAFCNQVIHSFVFMTGATEKGERGVFVSSDKRRNEEVLFVRLQDIIRMFRIVGEDYPSSTSWSLNPKTGKETVRARGGPLDRT